MWGWSTFERLLQDLRYTTRILRKSPGFTGIAILSLALGIGVNTAIFSLIDAVLLKPLPVRDPNQLVTVGDPTRTGSLSEGEGRADIFSYPFFERFREQQQVFTDMYATGRCEHLEVLLSNGTRVGTDEERIRCRFVTGNFFSLLGVHPVIGRAFTEPETRVPGSAPVIVISDGFWQRNFAADPQAVGGKLSINGSTFTIIGVMPPQFSGDIIGSATDIWFPITMQVQANPGHDYRKDRNVSWLLFMGRLKPGTSLARADASAQVLARRIFEDLYKGKQSAEGLQQLSKERIQVKPGAKGFSRIRRDFAAPLMILMGIVGLVLLICCANVANLQLARAAARAKEISLRLAVGAGQGRLLRQLVTESLLIALLGAALGLLLALWGTHLLLRIVYETGPLPLSVHLDATVLSFTAAAAIFAGLLFGLLPAFQATRLDLMSTLRETQGQQKAFARGFGKALIILQVVFSVVLLVCAGLFIRTLQNLEKIDVGYSRNGLVLANIDFKTAGYTDKRINQLTLGLLERLRQLPGIESASASENGLFSGTESESSVEVEGFDAHSLAEKQNRSDRVSPNYFYTVGTRIISGRGIGPQDVETSQRVAVINERMAQFYFRHENPVGKHLFESGADGKSRVAIPIVGVVRDVRQNQLREPPPRRFYTALLQHQADDPVGALNLEIRSRTASASMLETVRRALKNLDPRLPILDLKTADDLIGEDLQEEKMIAKLSSFFGALALLLAGIGLYGVMSYLTVRRTTEIGVRMALGARRLTVMGMVLRESIQLVAVGLVIGILVSLLLASAVSKILFGLSPFDPVTSCSAAVVITAAAVLATYLPARRASKIDPIIALRYE
jgi:predicted permease